MSKSECRQEDRGQGVGVPLSVAVAVVCAFGAAWVVAGSAGLLAYPMRRAVGLALLVSAVLAGRRREDPSPWLPSFAWFGLAAVMLASQAPLIGALACGVVLAGLARVSQGCSGRVFLTGAVAVTVWVLYRMLILCMPWAWLASDHVAGWLGTLISAMVGTKVKVGPTFAGLDLLVLTGTMWVMCLAMTPRPRLVRGLYAGLGILAGHLLYLTVLGYTPSVLGWLPVEVGQTPGPWTAFVHKALPWNLPVVGCLIHMAMGVAMLRWSPFHCLGADGGAPTKSAWRWLLAAVLVAAILPWLAFGHVGRPSLDGKKVVFYEKGFLNWLKPEYDGQYGRLSSGMYGMLPSFVASLGARAMISPDLSAQDLDGADALVLIFPDEPWETGQKERIWEFVRAGGSLLVMGEHTTLDPNTGSNRFDEILEPTAIRVAFDCAQFAVGGWLQSYEPILHPTTVGMKDDRNQFGVVVGASLDIHWPARPILLGKWGWSDTGDLAGPRAMIGDDRYNSGERLGDLVLSAEQPLGKGRVMAFGDTSGITNGINVGAFEHTSRLMAYLAGAAGSAHTGWRQVVTLLVVGCLGVLLVRLRTPGTMLLLCAVLAVSWTTCVFATHEAWQFHPRRQQDPKVLVACIDTSHQAAFSGESWRPGGIGGLCLTLMRNGYLVLDLPEISHERLVGVDLLVVVAPSREYSGKERRAILDFVQRGGDLVITVGYDRVRACRSLLRDLDLYVGLEPNDARESPALGHFKAPFLRSEDSQRQVYVRFHAAWPVGSTDPNAEVMAYGAANRPVILRRKVGTGDVVLVGDTYFATSQNLEKEDGSPFEGMRENADFWRWFIGRLRGDPEWIPDALTPQDQPSDKEEKEVTP